jgi:hypothetical protein
MRRRVKGQKHKLPDSGLADPISRAVQSNQEAIVKAAGDLGDKITRKSAAESPKNRKTNNS